MKSRHCAPLLLSLALLSACDKDNNQATAKQEEATSEVSLGRTVKTAMSEARQEIISGNMSLGGKNATAKGEITPKGDLLIDGKAVSITQEQRTLLIKHREILAAIAISGIEIGMQGIDLAGEAVGETIKGVFSGDTSQVEKKVEAEANKIEASANLLCEQLPLLLESQQKLAQSLPEFKPYATMTTNEIDDCHGKAVDRK